ncbi:MAG: RHS repeat-associated core domain-containing protein [Saprospiraceae bacterium]|nr:RHS repeat-associated core domain-containing protein [Saprospiraceae bacterium]MBK9727538.1 RHS repeat-associated core domain-containing protein [Saprospiraceae bacterium]
MWTAYGKVDSIVKSNNQRIKYEYDAMDHRIMKKINYAGGSLDTLTYYIYDAQGNVLSTYQKVKQTSGGSYAHVKLQDINLYGSERLGNMKVDSFMYASARLGSAGVARNYSMGKKRYELTDHLGNVYSTITDRRLGSGTAGQVVTVWNPDVLTAQDYLPYGMPIYDKLYKATSTSYYKYAFNGKEKDDETKGAFNSYDYGYRMYDPRVCRFLSVDPLASQAPSWNPYRYGFNNPIRMIDPDGQFETEAEAKAYAKLEGIRTGWFSSNKIVSNKDGTFSIDNKKAGSSTYNDKEFGIQKAALVTAKKQETHVKFANAVGNILGMDPTKMSDPKEGAEQAMNAASRIINVLSLVEGGAAIQGAKALGKGVILYGMANDANDLVDDLTGFDAIESGLGVKGAAINSTVNSVLGLRQSVKDKHGNIGNIGDIKDLIFETPKLFSKDKPKK